MDPLPTSNQIVKKSPFLRRWQWAFGGLGTMIFVYCVYARIGIKPEEGFFLAIADHIGIAAAVSCALFLLGLALGFLKKDS